MALTTFVDGTSTVWADFLNSIFNTGGGHRHNGGGNDGEANQIDIPTEIDWGTDGVATVTEPFASKTLLTLARTAGEFWTQCTGLLSSWVSTDQIYPFSGSEVDFQNPDTTWVDINVGDVVSDGDVEAPTVTTLDIIPQSGDEIHIENGVGSSRDLKCRDVDAGGEVSMTTGLVGSRAIEDYLPWLVCHCDDNTSPGNCTLNVNLNSRVTSVYREATAGTYTVTLALAVSNQNRPVLVTPESSSSRFCTVEWTSTTEFVIKCFNSIGTLADPSDGLSFVLWNP
jgi:hypothetical protein